MNSLSPIKIVVTFAVMLPLFLLCQAIGIPQGWTTTTVIAFVSISVGSLAAALCNPSRAARAIDRVKDGQTEDFLANLERGKVKVTQGRAPLTGGRAFALATALPGVVRSRRASAAAWGAPD